VIQPVWKTTTQLAPAQLPLTQNITNQQLFDKISNQLEEKLKIVDSHIIKIEQEIETNGKDILDLHQNISNIMEVLKTMIVEVISPVLKSIPKMDGKTKESIDKIVLSAREQIELIHQEIQTNIKSKQEKAELDDHQQLDISKK
jgi:sugar-specific transcriptional regulator TrmB